MLEYILPTIITAIVGAISAVWSYWRGRKVQASETSIKRTEAINELNETIDQQSGRINDLYEIVLTLKRENYKLATQNEKLLANQSDLMAEVEALRKELALYKRPAPKKKPTKAKTK